MEFELSSRQPRRAPWSREELIRARVVALGFSLESSTRATYRSGLNSYLSFANTHNLPLPPTLDSISFFIVYMSAHIDPKSVANYIHGISRCLEPYYPEIREICSSRLIKETLAGCKKLRSMPTKRKPPLLISHLSYMLTRFPLPAAYDDLLFIIITLLGHFGLHRLGELTNPDVLAHRSHRKILKRPSVSLLAIGYSYTLPYNKADRYYLGSTVIIASRPDPLNPTPLIASYLNRRDSLFPNRIELLLRADGSVPTRGWYISRLQHLFPTNGFGGHSLRAGGATELALKGTPEPIIRRMGRWTSEAWERYVRVHPVLLSAVLQSRNTPSQPSLNAHLTTTAPSSSPSVGPS